MLIARATIATTLYPVPPRSQLDPDLAPPLLLEYLLLLAPPLLLDLSAVMYTPYTLAVELPFLDHRYY